MSTAALRPIPGPDQIFDKLVVVTHQRAELQESTIQVLQSLVYAQTPNVIIASPQFSFQFPFGNWRPTYIQNGDDEMLGYPFVAKEVVFMGGYSALCLAITIHNIVMEAERLAMPEITLRFLSKYIYEIENYAPTIQQLFSKKKILEKDFFPYLNTSAFYLLQRWNCFTFLTIYGRLPFSHYKKELKKQKK